MTLARTAAFLLVAAMPAAGFAQSAEEMAQDALEARHGYMKMLSINMGTLAAMARGEMEYDEGAATTAATNLAALTRYDVPSLFVDGTAAGQIEDSEALLAIWENPDDFAAKFTQLAEAAAASPDAVKGGQGNVGPALQQLGGACKDCHDDFRQKN